MIDWKNDMSYLVGRYITVYPNSSSPSNPHHGPVPPLRGNTVIITNIAYRDL